MTERIYARYYATMQPVLLTIQDGRLSAIDWFKGRLQDQDTSELPIVSPGLVDLQINGYAGYDFNEYPLREETIIHAIRKLWETGVTTCFPTVITQSEQAIIAALTTIRRTCERDADTAQTIAGIHLEGPFISPEDGARGAHPLKDVRPPDWELFCRFQDAAGGAIKIITLSPEWPGSCDFIAKCAASGITVSIGHTSATAEQIHQAVQAGATMSTHLGNGAHLQLPRHPNYIWEQLAQDELWSTVIADGFHLPEQVLKVIMKVKGSQCLLVSDAVALSGMPPGIYDSAIGSEVVLTPEGKLHLASNPKLLAGSAQMLKEGIQHLCERGLTDLATALEMASIHPSRLMSLPAAQGITVGAPADLVLFRSAANQRMEILSTYKSGKEVYRATH